MLNEFLFLNIFNSIAWNTSVLNQSLHGVAFKLVLPWLVLHNTHDPKLQLFSCLTRARLKVVVAVLSYYVNKYGMQS